MSDYFAVTYKDFRAEDSLINNHEHNLTVAVPILPPSTAYTGTL